MAASCLGPFRSGDWQCGPSRAAQRIFRLSLPPPYCSAGLRSADRRMLRHLCCRSTCFAARSLPCSTATAICSFAVQGLAFVSLPFYLEDILGRSQVETGFFMTPWPLVVAIMAPIAARLSDRHPAGILGGVGLALLSLGMILLAMLPADPHVLDIVWRMAIWADAVSGFFQAPNMKALMSSAPADRSGSASGMGCDCTPDRTDDRRSACGTLFWPRRP